MIQVVFCSCFLFHLVPMAAGAEKMIITLAHVDIDEDPSYVNTTAVITRYASAPYFSLDITTVLFQTLDDLKVHVLYSIRTGTVDNTFYKRMIDFCAFLRRPVERIMRMVYDDIRRHARTPLPTSCPVQPAPFVFTNVTLSRVMLPTFLRPTSFQLQLKFTRGPKAQTIYVSRWYGRLKKVTY